MRKLAMPSLVSTFILLLAMSGAAAAAKFIITKPNQIKPSVRKVLEGATGPAGPAGTAGIQGPAGLQGPAGGAGEKGATGAAGTNGTNGTNGQSIKVKEIEVGKVACGELGGAKVEEEDGSPTVDVCNGQNGEKGEKGEKGEPWTPNNTLPVGATLTGTWSISATTTGKILEPISFPIKLAAATPIALDGTKVHYKSEPNFKDFDEGGPETVGCLNSQNNPTAPSGHLCVYQSAIEEPAASLTFVGILDSTAVTFGAGKAGALLQFEASEPGFTSGTWAVTG